MTRLKLSHHLSRGLKTLIGISLLLVGVTFNSYAQHPVINPNDPIVEYDDANPPETPAWGTMVKWVRSKRLGWDTDQYKSYFYKGMPFRIMFPKNYDPSGSTEYPMIIMLHGRGERGTIYDNEYSMKHGGKKHRDAVNSGKWPGFILYPQNTTGYFAESHFSILNDLINNHFPQINVNINRISVHGLSAGGQATWNTVIDYPKDYASAIPMSAAGLGYLDGIYSLQYIPMWISQGGKDRAPHPNTTEQVLSSLWESGVNIRYLLYPNSGHGVWNSHYNESDFFPFMERAHKANPVVTSGEPALVYSSSSRKVTEFIVKNEFCPDETIEVPMGLTAGFEAYEWRKDGILIPDATGNSFTATELGVYDARIKRAGEWSEWSHIPIEVKIKEATQTPDISVVGLASKVIPSPDGKTSVELELPNGYIQYNWYAEDDSITLGSSRTITISEPGNYMASVVEKFGCSSNLSQPFKVVDSNGANAPDPVNAFVGTAASKTEIRLNWSDNPAPVHNETNFEIYRTEESGGPYSLISITDADILSFTDTGLIPNTDYYYLIRSVNGNGASDISEEIMVKTLVDNIAPAAPLNLRITQKNLSSITLSWDEAVDDVGIYKYEIYRGKNKAAVVSGTTGTVYNLLEGEVYAFTVKARDFAGNLSPASNQVVGVPGFSGLYYKYYEGSWSGLPDFTSLMPVKEGKTNNVDINLRDQNDNIGFLWEGFINIETPGTYTFETRSDDGSKLYIGGYNETNLVVNNDGLHGMRNRLGTYTFTEAGAYPIAITFFERGGGQGMEVYWASDDASIARERIPDNAFQDDASIPDQVPAAPTDLVGAVESFDSISLAWTDNSNDETGFQIYRSESQSGPYAPVGIVDPNITSFTDSNLKPQTEYYYQVISLGQYGQSEGLAGPPISILPMNNGIAAKDNATGTGFIMYSEESVHQRFSSNPPHSQNADHFIAVRYNNGWQYDNNGGYYAFSPAESDLLIANVDFGADHLTDLKGSSGNTNGIEYGYADGDLNFIVNRWGSSSNNGEFYIEGSYFNKTVHSSVSVTTLPLPLVPDSPSDFQAESLSPNEIELSWIDNSDNENSFDIYRSVSNDQNFLLLETLEAEVTAFSDKNLFSNTKYFYQITATNEGGSSDTIQISSSTLNNIPELSPTGDIVMRYETVLEIPVYASDPDPEAIGLSVSNLPVFGIFEDYGDGTGLITLAPVIEEAGMYENVVISVSDEHSGVVNDTISIIVDDNNQPTLDPVPDISVKEGDSISVILTANDLDGSEFLSWDHNLPEFAKITPHLDGTATLTLAPYYIDGGSYPVGLVVNDQDGGSANQEFTIDVIEVNPNQNIYLNFAHSVSANSPWNNITSISSTDLLDDKGEMSGVSLDFQTTSWNAYRDGAVTGDNSGVYPDDVIKDYYYFGIFSAPETVSMDVSGLDPSKNYNFTFFASSSWANVDDNGTTRYSIGSDTVSVYVQNNTQNTVTLNGVTPDSSGRVTINMSKAPGTPVGYINSLVVNYEHDAGSIPSAPRKLTSIFNGDNVELNWVDAPFNEVGFEIFRSENDGPFEGIATIPANSQSYLDSDISENTIYTYKVSAFNNTGTSEPSNITEISIPNTPPSISVSSSVEIIIGNADTLAISATDPSSVTLVLNAKDLPSFASFNDFGNGEGELILAPASTDVGDYSITIEATDDQDAISSESISVSVIENKLYAVSVNFSGNLSAPDWNNTLKTPAIGDTFSNLSGENGENTGVSITLDSEFGGVYAEGATSGDNSGMVPDNVLKEYYWFGTFGAPETARITVGGLDNLSKYTFKFVGSSVFSGSGITDNGETIYSIGTKSVAVDVQANTSNLGVISDVFPNSNGEVVINISKGSGAQVGYINGMIIEAFETLQDEIDQSPTDLTAVGISKTTIELSWQDNAFEEAGFEIYKLSEEIFSLVSTTGPDVTSFTDSGLNSGTAYTYKIRAVLPEDNYSEFSNTASAATMAFAIYINLNGDPAYNTSEPWNNIGFLPDNGVTVSGFKNEFGNESGIIMNFQQSMTGSNDWGASTGDNSGIYPDAVLKSFYFMEALEEANISVEGLDQSYIYNFNFLGAIETNYDVYTEFTINNETVTNSQTYNTSTASSIKGVQPDINNSVGIHVVSSPGSRWSIWNSLVIEAYPNTSNGTNTRVTSNMITPENTMLATFGDIPATLELDIYPNPFSESLKVVLSDIPDEKLLTITMLDISGNKLIEDQNIDIESGTYTLDFSNLELNSGVYILQIKGEGVSRTFKILKK